LPRDAEFHAVADSLPHIVWVAGLDGSAEYVNRRGREYTGCTGRTDPSWELVAFAHPDDMQRARREWEDSRRAGTPFDLRFRIRRADGEFRWHACHASPVRDADGRTVNWIGTATDVEDQDADEVRSVVMANMAEGVCAMDAEGRLTFMNTAASRMLGWSERELRGKPVHTAIHYQRADGSPFPGEESAMYKARAQNRTVRVADDAFTRKDGSIFPVAYSAAPLLNGADVHGVVAVFRDTSEERSEQEHMKRELDALNWVGRTRDAIDEGRLVLYSQPIIPLADGGLSEELLLRLVGREGEIIRPGNFLPSAEKYGLIGEIDRWVVAQAARRAAGGRRVQVNLSATSVSTLDLLPLIESTLREAGADPSDLVFELTETALMQGIEAGEVFARGLTEIGAELALDDFGTGFGSFTYLKRLPIHYLKIDQEFVHDLASNSANQHVVEAIVALARGFGQRTIAEGVEDQETLELLHEYRVDFAQGYHLGRPAPLEDDARFPVTRRFERLPTLEARHDVEPEGALSYPRGQRREA
jgi:PAS domain S-box-containing protein